MHPEPQTAAVRYFGVHATWVLFRDRFIKTASHRVPSQSRHDRPRGAMSGGGKAGGKRKRGKVGRVESGKWKRWQNGQEASGKWQVAGGKRQSVASRGRLFHALHVLTALSKFPLFSGSLFRTFTSAKRSC